MTFTKPKARPGQKRSLFRLIPRHGAFAIAAATGLIAYALGFVFAPDLAIGIGANTWFVVYLGLVFYQLPELTPEKLKIYADEEDPPVLVITLVTVAVVGVAAFALFAALNGGEKPDPAQVVIGIASIILGWFVVHTMAALHYAFEYYETPEGSPKSGKQAGNVVGGFEWPEGDPPNGVAFLYVSYQIGAALQISDVPATSNKMRKLILIHTVFSFFYNTMLVAAGVNVVILAAGGG
jgi:uncharacterized membrane protein